MQRRNGRATANSLLRIFIAISLRSATYLSSNPKEAYFEEDYALAALDLGNGRLGELSLGYFDKAGGGYAIGTRRTLNEEHTAPQTDRDCQDAFLTSKDIQNERALKLPFGLVNPCHSSERDQLQKMLGIAM